MTYKLRVWCFWEAGEIPARPRHCECRGFEQFATGDRLWEGSSHLLTHESGDRPDARISSIDFEGRVDGRRDLTRLRFLSAPRSTIDMVTLVLGGVRSGKSRYAQSEAARFSRVTFVATARRSDEEMRRKIAAHRRERPAGWKTVEVSTALDAVIRREGQKAEVLLVDCLTTYCGQLISRSRSESVRRGHVEGIVEAIRATPASVFIVSNEVGSGVVPAFKSSRLFRDMLGEMNQAIARVADRVVLLVAGVPIAIKGALS